MVCSGRSLRRDNLWKVCAHPSCTLVPGKRQYCRCTWEALALGATSRCLFTIYITKVIYAGLPVDISVFVCLRKQQPRFAQGQPKCYYQMKELDRTTTYRYCRGEWEMRSSCRGDSLLPFGAWWDMKGDPRQLAVPRLSVNDLRMSAVKCSILRQPHHVLETFRPFLVKVTRAAQSDFGLVQLQVNRKLLLNWICLGVQRNRLCHTAGPVQLMQPNFPYGRLSRDVRWHQQAGNMECGHWEGLHD